MVAVKSGVETFFSKKLLILLRVLLIEEKFKLYLFYLDIGQAVLSLFV